MLQRQWNINQFFGVFHSKWWYIQHFWNAGILNTFGEFNYLRTRISSFFMIFVTLTFLVDTFSKSIKILCKTLF